MKGGQGLCSSVSLFGFVMAYDIRFDKQVTVDSNIPAQTDTISTMAIDHVKNRDFCVVYVFM